MWSARSGTMSAAARCRPNWRPAGFATGFAASGELPTGVVDKRRDAAGVNAYEILPGAWDAMTWSDALARLAARTDVVCFGSLAQRSAASHATVVRFLDGVIRRERPTLRVFDVNLRQDFFSREVLEESMARCNILKISDEEAPRVAGCLTGCPAADPGGCAGSCSTAGRTSKWSSSPRAPRAAACSPGTGFRPM